MVLQAGGIDSTVRGRLNELVFGDPDALSLTLFRGEHRSVTNGSAGSTNHLLGQTGGFGTHLPNWDFMPYGRGAKGRYTRV